MSMLNAEASFLLIEEGRKTEALDISTHCGGGAVNAAVALARLGFDVSALVKLGRDARADLILSRLAAEKISTRWVARDAAAPTGASVILASHERNACVFTFRGANAILEPEDLASGAFEKADLAYVAGLSGKSSACLPHAIEKARAAGALVAVNATVRQLSAHPEDFLASLAKIDILALNRREAEALLPALVAKVGHSGPLPRVAAGEHLPPLLTRGLVAGSFEIGLPAFFGTLRNLGTRYVMLTDGGRGAFVCANHDIIYCPAESTTVASTAGAGDAMTATFAAFITMDYPADVALRAATLNAASVVSHIDTQSGLLRRDKLEAHLDAHADLKLRKWKM
ncbi:MAG: carbohydrate kinase family protein [Hyphomicrobium sp.]